VEVATVEGVRLAWEQASALARLTVERPQGEPRQPPATLHFAARDRRVRVSVVLLGGRREIDVSIQPAVVVATVGAGAEATDAAQWQVGGWLSAFAAANDTWRPRSRSSAGPDLLAIVAGGAFPLLGAAFARGAGPVREVPRWAAPVVGCADARAAATLAFGARATRPVVAALAASLVAGDRGRPVSLYPLALGLMAPALGPDRLARVLRVIGPERRPEEWPDGEVVAAARRLTPELGEHRTERLLVDGAVIDDGPTVLADALCTYGLVRHRLGRRLPNRLAEFRAHCAALLPPDPNPDGVVAPRRRSRPAPEPTAAAQRRGAMLRAPATAAAAVDVNLVLAHPTAVSTLAGREVTGNGNRLRFVVPRTAAELAEWGRRLHNCVGGFGPAVHEGRSWLFGVEADERLAYCIEVRPGGDIRQFHAAHNRPVPRRDALAVVHALAVAGIVDPGHVSNGPWFEPPAP